MMKIKNLPKDRGLGGVRFRYPGDGKLYYWVSQWQKGVWGKTDLLSNRVYPLHCDDLSEAAEWEVVESGEPSSVPNGNDKQPAAQGKPK